MKKILLFSLVLVNALCICAQTVSTASVSFRYCAPRYFEQSATIPNSLFPYTVGGVTYTKPESTTTIHSDVNGCDSVVTVAVIGFNPLFTVASGRTVTFSKGNLQYQASTNTWRMASRQWRYIGEEGGNVDPSKNQTEWIDLFSYGASGFNNVYPYLYANQASLYPSGDIANTNYDWGFYNVLQESPAQGWRVLTNDEWNYLFKTRTNCSAKYSIGMVNDTIGLIILPDTWTLPTDLSFTPQATEATANQYTLAQWEKMELAGAVFLPTCGQRVDGYLSGYSAGVLGNYWASTKNGSDFGTFHFNSNTGGILVYGAPSSAGQGVRLVKTVQ